MEGALIPPNSGGFAAVGDRRLESVPTTLPSFSAQQQQQPFATDVAFGMTYNVPTALGTPYMAQGQPMAPQEMSSLPLVQQFLAHRASTPEYSVHTAGSSPFVEPGAEGGGVAGPSWIAPRASHMSVGMFFVFAGGVVVQEGYMLCVGVYVQGTWIHLLITATAAIITTTYAHSEQCVAAIAF